MILICRCHKCNEERDVNSTKKLQEAAEFLKRHFARAVPEVPEGKTKNNFATLDQLSILIHSH